ncbi:uncharacterized protein LOC126554059 [Aphis gossypii]|uniref:uncharacterized protein LOC126554059 n=1 Tax=Aphis gossypii TaxID=80765 RepID=UPI00215948BF|nr:uncharacterized protein LOC126554059 [Aphis gossypii]
MYVADLLSRNYVRRSNTGEESLKDVIHTVSDIEIKYENSKEQEFIQKTQNDEVLGNVLEYCKYSWPKSIKEDDIAEFEGKSYLIVVDYYSRWIEILELYNKTSDAVIEVLKKLFSRLSVPKQLIADNMPFSSYTFIEFSKKWNFQVITSSPHYAQSNGLSEQGVGIAKDMLKKSNYTGTDINF